MLHPHSYHRALPSSPTRRRLITANSCKHGCRTSQNVCTSRSFRRKGTKMLKIKRSDKSTVVQTSAATLAAAKDLMKLGITLNANSSCDDVGVEMGGDRRRLANSQHHRAKKNAKDRAKRVKAMVLRNRTALKLVMTGVAPQQAYGRQVNGATAAQTQAMRTNLKSAARFRGHTLAQPRVSPICLALRPTHTLKTQPSNWICGFKHGRKWIRSNAKLRGSHGRQQSEGCLNENPYHTQEAP